MIDTTSRNISQRVVHTTHGSCLTCRISLCYCCLHINLLSSILRGKITAFFWDMQVFEPKKWIFTSFFSFSYKYTNMSKIFCLLFPVPRRALVSLSFLLSPFLHSHSHLVRMVNVTIACIFSKITAYIHSIYRCGRDTGFPRCASDLSLILLSRGTNIYIRKAWSPLALHAPWGLRIARIK